FQPVADLTGEGRAHVAGGVPDHERQQLRRRLLRSEDQVAFVLPVGVVDHHDGFPGGDVGHRLLDRAEDNVVTAVAVSGYHGCRRSRALDVGFAACRHSARFKGVVGGGGHAVTSLSAYRVRRSTYFATTSTSRFTRSPGF